LWGLNFLLILLAATLVVRLKPLASGLLLAGSLLGVLLLAAFFLARFGIWMKFISTEAGLLGAFVGGTGYRLAEERWLKRRVETERNRFEQELSLARTIQEGLLPESLPQVEGLEFGVRYETSLLVGGDYYDFFQPNATTLLFVVADVEGKGAASALIMSNVQATLHALLRSAAPSPEWIVATLNACVIESAHSRKLITLFLGWIDLPSRELRYVNAGHLPPLLARTTGDMLSLSEGGMLLGFSPPGTYTSGSVELLPSDVLAVFTDGITEAANTHAEEFGTERLAMAINRSRVKSAGKIADDVFAEVRSFSAGGTHEDDKVVMVIKVC
jgi:sigma-B regulation protein RsbU (phosphoserine phosphatase)